MSISPVREAVRRLEALGLAVHVPHRGAWVSELAIEDLHDTYEVRLTLETLAVRRAATRFTKSDGDDARAFLEQYAAAHRRGDFTPRPQLATPAWPTLSPNAAEATAARRRASWPRGSDGPRSRGHG